MVGGRIMTYRHMPLSAVHALLELHHLWLESQGQAGKRLELNGVEIRSWNCADQDLSEAWFINTRCVDLSAARVNLCAAYLDGASFIGADLRGASLRKAEILHTDLTDADLQHVDAVRTDWTSSRLRRSNLTGANLRHGFFMRADLRQAILTGTHLALTCFNEAQMYGIQLEDVHEIDGHCTTWIDVGEHDALRVEGHAMTTWLFDRIQEKKRNSDNV
jgi:hypothetical protein